MCDLDKPDCAEFIDWLIAQEATLYAQRDAHAG
jgi:hypothetical protein